MAIPTLNPKSTISAIVLPATGSPGSVAGECPFGMYTGSAQFLSGASEQVAYTFKKLGGDILDLEITTGSVYAAYEEAVLEYSYIVNMHQAKNILPDVLGMTTGTFDRLGEITSSLSSSHVALKYPKFTFSYSQKVSDAFSTDARAGGTTRLYSASFQPSASVQDYDLQAVLNSASNHNLDAATGNPVPYAGFASGSRIIVDKVYYKTPASMWRFFGYYGGLNTVGNLANYGQYADDSTFQLIPVWQNKAQAMAFEDSIYTRNSHYSFELNNNMLRIFPSPPSGDVTPDYFWFRFRIVEDAWAATSGSLVDGINNMNTVPFANIPYKNINSIGKQWIRRFALSLCKETLGQVRSKFATLPIPGESVTLNGPSLISEGREEQVALRTELKEVLDELTYQALAEKDSAIADSVNNINKNIPAGVFVG
jgi:predicted lipoprotein with Yx(FWY)xxD motif